MMKTLLACIALLSAFSLTAQRQHVTIQPQSYSVKNPEFNLGKSAPEVVEPPLADLECFTSDEEPLVAYFDSVPEFQGFITGSNSLGDQEKLQRLVYEDADEFEIQAVAAFLLDFQAEDIPNGFLYAVVYDEPTSNITFAEPVGTSDTIMLEDITFGELTEFTFSNPVVMDNDSFLVGLNFSGTYTATGDTTGFVGIVSSKAGCGNVDNVYEKFSTPDGDAYDNFFEFWEVDLELYLIAVVDAELTSTRQPLADYGATIFPNPAADLATLRLSAKSNGHYVATLTDLNGRQLRRSVPDWVGGQPQIEWQVSDLATGMYLYHVDGPEGRQSGKVMVR